MPALRPIDQKLISAAYNNDIQQVTDLLKQGADVNARDHTFCDQTPLMYAVQNNNTDITALLLSYGADPSLTNCLSYNTLIIACLKGFTTIAKLLITITTNINAQTPFGDTALLSALEWGQADTAILLLNNGADPNIMNISGQNALMLANGNKCSYMTPLIELYSSLTHQAIQDESLFVLTLKEAISQYYQKDTALLEQIVTTPNASLKGKLEKLFNPKFLTNLYKEFGITN